MRYLFIIIPKKFLNGGIDGYKVLKILVSIEWGGRGGGTWSTMGTLDSLFHCDLWSTVGHLSHYDRHSTIRTLRHCCMKPLSPFHQYSIPLIMSDSDQYYTVQNRSLFTSTPYTQSMHISCQSIMKHFHRYKRLIHLLYHTVPPST